MLFRQYVGGILSAGSARILETLFLAVLLKIIQIDSHLNQAHAEFRHFLPGFLIHGVPFLPCGLQIARVFCCRSQPGIVFW